MSWTTPADVRAQVQKHWDNGRLLRDAVGTPGGSHELATDRLSFPLTLRLRGPTPRELATRHDEVRAWIRELEAESHAALGYGYEIGWSETSNRLIGRNRTPSSILVPTRTDALALIGHVETAERFAALARSTIDRFPELGSWLQQRPLKVLEHEGAWERILAVLDWLRANPRSGRFVREIDVPGVDTKFIEARRPLLAELLDLVIPAAAIDLSRSGSGDFEARYGLAAKPALVRFRILDPYLAIHGLTDLTVRIDELVRLDLAVERVLIVENEITGLALPAMNDVKSAIIPREYQYDGNRPWIDQVLECHAQAAFDGILASGAHANAAVTDADPGIFGRACWECERRLDVPRTPNELADALALILTRARDVIIVDPYFNPSVAMAQSKWLRPLSALAAKLRVDGQLSRFEVHALSSRREPWPAGMYSNHCRNNLAAVLPRGLSLSALLWKERAGGLQFHERLLVTDLGGVVVDPGIDDGQAGETYTLRLLGKLESTTYLKKFVPATAPYDLVEQEQVVGV